MTREEREAIKAEIIELLDKLGLIPAEDEQPEQIAAQSAAETEKGAQQ